MQPNIPKPNYYNYNTEQPQRSNFDEQFTQHNRQEKPLFPNNLKSDYYKGY